MEQNAPLPVLAYTWMNLKTHFSVYGVTNIWYVLGISMTFSLYGHMEKKNLTDNEIWSVNKIQWEKYFS